MDIFYELLLNVVSTGASSIAGMLKKRMPLEKSGKDSQIERIDRRMSMGIAKRDGKYKLALLVERADSWALEKAEQHESREPSVIVEVTGKAYSAHPNKKINVTPQKRLSLGISIGHFRGNAGTLGGFVEVYDNGKKLPALIGSSHVLSMINTGEKNDDIIHPGWPDGPRVFKNRIGKLTNYTYLVHYQQKGDALNREDIAIVRPIEEKMIPSANLVPNPKDQKRRIKLKGCIPSDKLFEQLGESVYKLGRNGFSEGTLEVVNVPQYSVQFPNGKVYIFQDVGAVKNKGGHPFSKPGDSGSIIYNSAGQAIGTVLGASSTHSFFVPLSTSLEAVEAELRY